MLVCCPALSKYFSTMFRNSAPSEKVRVCLVRSELTNLEVQYLIILLSNKLSWACILGKRSIGTKGAMGWIGIEVGVDFGMDGVDGNDWLDWNGSFVEVVQLFLLIYLHNYGNTLPKSFSMKDNPNSSH